MLVRKLVEKNERVTCLIRKTSNTEPLKKLGVTLCEGDITDRDSLKRGMRDADIVFHIAAMLVIGMPNKREMFEVNVKGTENVLEIAESLNIKKVVHCSTIGIFGDSGGKTLTEKDQPTEKWASEYERTKALAHKIALKYASKGLNVSIVMPGVIFGPDDPNFGQLIRAYIEKRIPALPKTDNSAGYVHVEDCANGIILAAEKGLKGESYILVSENLKHSELADYIEKFSGISRPKKSIGYPTAWFFALLSELSAMLTGGDAMLTREGVNQIFTLNNRFDSSKARKELGWKPEPIEKRFRETVEWYLQNR